MGKKKKKKQIITNRNLTASEVKEFYTNTNNVDFFNDAATALKKISDVNKTINKRITAFKKDDLQLYLQNIGSNEKNLRNLSRYLYYRCNPYFKLIQYFSNMFCLYARSVIPEYDITKDNDKEKFLKSYGDTLNMLERMNLQYEFYKAYVACFREDVFYGVSYLDQTGFFILPFDPDYCKISGIYATGDYAFSINMSYFRGANNYLLEYYGEPFISMYNAYDGKTSQQWQNVPAENSVCLKFRTDEWDTIVPPFSGIFNSIINLLGEEDIQAIADEQQIYKLIWMELETLANTKLPDDWKVNPDLAVGYFNKMIEEALPDYVSAALIPGKLQQINFNSDFAADTTKVSKATETLFNTSGGAQILNSATISGSVAFNAAVKADTEFAISPLLPQTEAIVNRLLSTHIENSAKVKFFPVSVYTIEEYRKNLLQDGQYGLPVKLAINTLNNFTEKETLALNFLEVECLKLNETFIPLQSSHTQSNKDAVTKPTLDDTEITSEGEASRDKADNS